MFNFNLGYFLLDKYLPLYFCFCFSWLLYAAVVAAIAAAVAVVAAAVVAAAAAVVAAITLITIDSDHPP